MNMRPRHMKRVARVEQSVATQPIDEDALQNAFASFRATGVLPQSRRLAEAVTDKALLGHRTRSQALDDLPTLIAELRSCGNMSMEPDGAVEDRISRSVRRSLFAEAIHGHELVQQAARGILRWAAARGIDLTDPKFLADQSMPEFGSVALDLLGFPECLAVPPYKAQVRRLLVRNADLRSRIDTNATDWFEPIGSALVEFRASGRLPSDELLQGCVLADSEFLAFAAHYLGAGDAELLAAFDTAARARGADQSAAIAVVQEMVRSGRLFSRAL